MSGKIWIVNSLDESKRQINQEQLDNYMKNAIETGALVKLSYVNKEVQAFIKACVNDQVYKGEIDPKYIAEYIKEYQTSTKILFVDENYFEEKLLNFCEKGNGTVDLNEINRDEKNWLDFGGINKLTEKDPKIKKVKEKTDLWAFLIAILPYLYFIGNYSHKFISVLNISTLFSIIVLLYQIAKKKANILNYSLAGLFVFTATLRLWSPYWINSIGALFITLGLCFTFLAGEYMGKGILSIFYKTSKRKDEEYQTFTVLWLVVLAVISAQIIYNGRLGFLMSSGLVILMWVITSVNLKGCEVEVIETEVKEVVEENETLEETFVSSETIENPGNLDNNV